MAWTAVTPLLADNFTIYAMDRRGRGSSGDGADYHLEREIEDIVAVVEGIGTGVHLYGHSFGGTLAAEAATRVSGLSSLMLYEGGPRPPGSMSIPDDLILRLESSIAKGHRQEVVETFALNVAGLTPDELEVLKQSPVWRARLAAAHTIPRELRATNEYAADLDKFHSVTVPTLLLLGGASPPRRRASMEVMAGIIPTARIVELEGQGHTANQTAPHLLAAAINAFVGALQNRKK
jgi:pimeloyl-ACP methyl ester carboxylesterase